MPDEISRKGRRSARLLQEYRISLFCRVFVQVRLFKPPRRGVIFEVLRGGLTVEGFLQKGASFDIIGDKVVSQAQDLLLGAESPAQSGAPCRSHQKEL